jgi:hypothetical protein
MAKNILEREGKEQARKILDLMLIEISADGDLRIREQPSM